MINLTELIWDGKCDKDGHKVAPLRVRFPFQTVETVNEDSKQRQISLEMFTNNHPTEWRNRLFWGEKKYVLPALLDEFAGQVKLIYIDPPYNTGQDFSYRTRIEGEEFTKEPNITLKRYPYNISCGIVLVENVRSSLIVDESGNSNKDHNNLM
jgi:hypothetical protein